MTAGNTKASLHAGSEGIGIRQQVVEEVIDFFTLVGCKCERQGQRDSPRARPVYPLFHVLKSHRAGAGLFKNANLNSVERYQQL